AISDQLATGREDMIALARQAAEEVVAKLAGGASKEQMQMLAQLAGDLRSLEELARNSDDRNTRTFEAIHDTLVKVAERIAGLEHSMRYGDEAPAPRFAREQAEPAPQRMAEMPAAPDMARQPQAAPKAQAYEPHAEQAEAEKTHIEDAPPVDFAAGEQPRAKQQSRRVTRQGITPAEAAAMAARAALGNDAGDEAEPADIAADAPKRDAEPSKGFLSSLRKSIRRGGKEEAVKPEGEPEEPAVFGKAGEAALKPLDLADEPLEPGSGAPDLAEIMKRVRAERSGAASAQADTGVDDAGKSDFIAAARRAARAARRADPAFNATYFRHLDVRHIPVHLLLHHNALT
ncbi:MAG: hypothetical protein KAH44_02945, partial [Oricola sp.]|nr:hypothetical protein [Oricola sp.]